MANASKNIDFYKNGDTFIILIGKGEDVEITNEKESTATGVEVTITLPTGLSFDPGQSTVLRGSFDEGTGVWSLGTIFGADDDGGGNLTPKDYPEASFSFQIDDSCEGPFDINFGVTSDGCECTPEDNNTCITITGTSCCDILSCGESANNEKIYNIPTTAFADTQRPTLAEVTTWATNSVNVPVVSQDNGTILTYTPLVFSEVAIYDDINVELVSLGPAEANTRIFRIVINGTNYDQDFIATSDAVFDSAAFKTFIETSMTTEGVSGVVVVTEDIDGNTRVDVDITSNAGIESFGILSKSDVTDPLEENYDLANGIFSNNGGRKSPEYIWVMSDDGGISITELFRAQDDGKVLYVRADGDDDVAEIGDPHKPYRTLRRALREASNSDTVKFFIDSGENVIVNFEDFSDKKVYFLGDASDTSTLLTFGSNNTVDANSYIRISGTFRSANAVPLIELHSDLSDRVFITNALLVNDGSVKSVGTDAATNITAMNVATNVAIGNIDPNLTINGEIFVRDSNYR